MTSSSCIQLQRVLSPRAPDPRPSLSRSVSSCRSLGDERRPRVFLLRQPFYTTLVKKSQEANGHSNCREHPSPRLTE